MLKLWLCFLSFFYTVNSFSTEEEKVKKKCYICLGEENSSSLIESKEIFSCKCKVDHTICKDCILELIEKKINLKKEKELIENNKKIEILGLIFGAIKDGINENFLQNFAKNIIGEKEKIEKEEEEKNIKIGEYQQLNEEEKLVYSAINKRENKDGNTIFYIGEEKDPTKQLKFIKSFLPLLEEFNKESHESFTRDIEWSIFQNCHQEMKIKEIEKWEEKDVEIEVSCELGTTELQKKIKNEKIIRIECPFCRYGIEKESAFFLKKIFGEPSSQESSKKFSCLKYCGNICSDCF